MQTTILSVNGVACVALSNDAVSLTVCPDAGGKIVSLMLNDGKRELLWNNPNLALAVYEPGAEYDPHFFGGIDELLPNDEQETLNGLTYPDHGELWTSRLDWEAHPHGITLRTTLPISGLAYEKTLTLEGNDGTLHLDYRITNLRNAPNPLLLKMHAALQLHPGDRLVCDAARGEIADADFTGRHGQRFFDWPHWGTERLDEVPGPEAERNEFFFLHNLRDGSMRMESPEAGTYFSYHFDTAVFPYAWYFATYGGWNGLYTGVLEPASAVPTRLSQSIADTTCTVLAAQGTLATRVTINAGSLS